MKAKARIALLAGLCVAGTVGWLLWPSGEDGELRYLAVGTSTNDPRRVGFVITNTSSKTFFTHDGWSLRQPDGSFVHLGDFVSGGIFAIQGRSSITIDAPRANLGEGWRSVIIYSQTDERNPPLWYKCRQWIAYFADRANMTGVRRWCSPRLKERRAEGPIMNGDRPAAVQKP
jgi:hypothetical protein